MSRPEPSGCPKPPAPRFGIDGRVPDLLRLTLQAGVPLRIAEYQCEERSVDWLIARCRWASEVIAANGDALLFRRRSQTIGGRQVPGTSDVCNALIEALAAAALIAPGGIRFLDLTFQAPPPTRGEPRDQRPARS